MISYNDVITGSDQKKISNEKILGNFDPHRMRIYSITQLLYKNQGRDCFHECRKLKLCKI